MDLLKNAKIAHVCLHSVKHVFPTVLGNLLFFVDAKKPEAEESSPEPRERSGERSRTPSPEDRTDDKGEKSDASSFEDLGQEGADV